MKAKLTMLALCVAAIVALSTMGALKAEGAPLAAANMQAERVVCSLPYIDDANEYGPGKVIVTVVCCGDAKSYQLKVTNEQGKKVKVTKHKKRVWSVVLRKGRTYKLSVRPKGGVYRSIYYGVC